MTVPVKYFADGTPVPELGFGCWRFGGAVEPDPSADAADLAAMVRAVEAGFRHFDTAEYYAAGHSEELLGQAVAASGVPRREFFLTSKVWKSNLTYDGVLHACHGSLERLGTDYLDLYLIHRADAEFDLGEVLRALNRLAAEGVVRHIGVSNFALPRLRRAQALSEAPIAVNQIHYNLAVRGPETSGLLEYCRGAGILLTAYRPLMYLDLQAPPLVETAARHRVTPAEAALNWLLSQEGVTALAATRAPGHLAANLAATRWRMAPGDIEMLRREFPRYQTLNPSVELL